MVMVLAPIKISGQPAADECPFELQTPPNGGVFLFCSRQSRAALPDRHPNHRFFSEVNNASRMAMFWDGRPFWAVGELDFSQDRTGRRCRRVRHIDRSAGSSSEVAAPSPRMEPSSSRINRFLLLWGIERDHDLQALLRAAQVEPLDREPSGSDTVKSSRRPSPKSRMPLEKTVRLHDRIPVDHGNRPLRLSLEENNAPPPSDSNRYPVGRRRRYRPCCGYCPGRHCSS